MPFRGFAAVDVGVQPALQALTEALRQVPADLKVVAPENLHLTLKFLGEVRDEKEEPLRALLGEAARGVPPVEVRLRGVGTFPPKGAPRVVWAGLEGADPLAAVAARIERGAVDLGFPREERRWSPHVTLARSRSPRGKDEVIRFVQAHREDELGRFVVDEVRLMRSDLSPAGPRYSVVASFPLEG